MSSLHSEPKKLPSLRYRERGTGFSRRIMLDGNTHLGRISYPEHKSPRELPPIWKKATVAVVVDGDSYISRNHALILMEDGKCSVCDLNSLNGTNVNGERLVSGVERLLAPNDIIEVAHTRLIFTYEAEVEASAILVGNPGFPPLRGIENDLRGMEAALQKRKTFEDHFSILFGDKATRQAVLNALEIYAALATENSLLVFYFAGHGDRSGLNVFDGVFSPHDLYQKLRDIRGKKIVILDACHSSVFLDGRSANTLVISGESPEGHLYEGAVSTVIGGACRFVQGFLTRAFIKLLEEKKEAIDLKAVANELGRYHKLRHHGVSVHAGGSTINLRSETGAWKP